MSTKSDTTKSISAALRHIDEYPDSAGVRLPVVAAWFAVSPATVWRRVKSGDLPAPQKFGPKMAVWNVGQLRQIKMRMGSHHG